MAAFRTDFGTRLTRRSLLAGSAGAFGAMALYRPSPARALGRFSIGVDELIVVSDGSMTLPLGLAYPDIAKAETEPLLAAAGLPTEALTSDCNVSVLRRGDRLAVFDVGAGAGFLPTTGKLSEGLAEAAIDPAAVTDVVFTHAHPDHLWGLTDEFDELVFPNASYRISRAEWDFWSSAAAIDAMPEERKSFAVGAQNRFAAIGDRVNFFEPGDEVLPGVEVVDTRGHTPGHASFLVHGADDPVLIVGDAISNFVVSLERPDWHAGSDQDPERGARTRMALLDRLATDRGRMIAFHFPHPAGGTVERKGNGYRFVPL